MIAHHENDDGTTTCRSCKKEKTRTDRWNPVIIKGTITGYTCDRCPRHGEPIVRKENGAGVRYQVRLTAGTTITGKQVFDKAHVFDSLSDAKKFVTTRKAELQEKRKREVRDRSKMTVDTLCGDFLEFQRGRVREVTRESYLHALKPVRRLLGHRLVESLDYDDVERLAGWLTREGGNNGRPLGRRAATLALAMLARVLDRAIRPHKVISINVARGITLPVKDTPAVDADELERWSEDEWNRFLDGTGGDVHQVAWMLLAQGCRREEVLGLTWDAVDFDDESVRIKATRVRVSKSTDPRGWMEGQPKSMASRRTIKPDKLVPGTMNALRTLYLAAEDKSGFVVLDGFGEPVEPSRLSRRFAVLCDEVGVPKITVHSTRHTVAFLLHSRGVDMATAAKHLGHRTDVHARIYLFAMDSDVHDALDAMAPLRRTAAGS